MPARPIFGSQGRPKWKPGEGKELRRFGIGPPIFPAKPQGRGTPKIARRSRKGLPDTNLEDGRKEKKKYVDLKERERQRATTNKSTQKSDKKNIGRGKGQRVEKGEESKKNDEGRLSEAQKWSCRPEG